MHDDIQKQLADLRQYFAEQGVDSLGSTGTNVNDNDARAMLSLRYTHMVPIPVLCKAFRLSSFSLSRILRGRTHAKAFADFQVADKAEWDVLYLRPDHVRRVAESRGAAVPPKKPQPPQLSPARKSAFAGSWEAYRESFHVHMRGDRWVVGETADDDSSDRDFASSKEASEYGIAAARSFAVSFMAQWDGQFFRTFAEQPEWPRSEWLPTNWRRLS